MDYYNQTVPVNIFVIIAAVPQNGDVYGMITYTCFHCIALFTFNLFVGRGAVHLSLGEGELGLIEREMGVPPSPKERGECIPHSREGEGTVLSVPGRGRGENPSVPGIGGDSTLSPREMGEGGVNLEVVEGVQISTS